MADYHPLIARAVAGLEKNTGENRRALYERARVALVAQLRGVVPALDESEITRERLALEEAIRKVEGDAARQAREALKPNLPVRPRPAPPPSGPLMPRGAPPPPPATEGDGSDPRPAPPPRRSLADQALRQYRETPPTPPAPTFAPPPYPSAAPLDEPRDDARPPEPPAPLPGIGQLEPTVHHETWSPNESRMPPAVDLDSQPPPVRPGAHDDEEDIAPPPRRSYAGLIRTVLLLALLIGVGSVLFWQRATIIGVAAYLTAMFQSSPAAVTTPAREASSPTSRPKITDRIGQPSSSAESGPAVAQRVVLYEEEPDDPQGKRYVGTVVWRLENRPAAGNRPAEQAVRGDIEVPERKMSMTFTLRRNTDASLPASHTVEIVFTLPADSPTSGVQKVPGVLMKQAEQTRGVPLAGLAVPVTPGYFLIGLSALETDMQRNIQLLKERSWIDVPIIYNNNRRAILALEKGTPGEQAFNQAFAVWRQ